MFIIRSTFVRTLIGLSLGTFAIGCGGPEEEGAVQEQELGTLESALCTDAGAENHTAALGSMPGDKVTSTSSSPPPSNPLCPSYYVVEATQTYGKKVVVSAAWVDSTVRDSEARCKGARLEATAYGAALFSGWQQIGATKTVTGTWDSFFGCSFMWTPSIEVASLDTARYSRIRVVTRATLTTSTGTYLRAVNGTIAIPDAEPAPVP
jgi:hypothetical protein